MEKKGEKRERWSRSSGNYLCVGKKKLIAKVV
jgi:hypothetical protein